MIKEYNIDDEVYLLDLTSYQLVLVVSPCAEQQQPMSLTRRLRRRRCPHEVGYTVQQADSLIFKTYITTRSTRCRAMMKMWKLSNTDDCDCRERQTMSHLMTCGDAPNWTWTSILL